MPYTAKVSSPGISVDTNNDGAINGRIHRIKNAGNFNTFTIANGELTVEGPTGGSAIGGSDTQVQFNDGGSSLAGHAGLTFSKTSDSSAGRLTVANLTVSGELIVTTTTTLNSNTVNIGDNILVLNSDATGSASADAGIEIERGDDANVQFLWVESSDSWDFDTYNLASVGRIYAAGSSTPVYSFTSDTNTGIEHAAADAMGLMVNGIRRVHIGVNGMSIVGLDGSTAAAAAGANQALLVDNISIDDQTIATTGSNKNLVLHPHGSGKVELAGVDSNATAIVTTDSAHNVVGTSVTIQAGSTTAGTTNNIGGGSLTIKAGAGKGSGAGGNIVFQTANEGSSGSSINAHATALTIQDDLSAQFTGNVSIAGGLTVTGTTTSVNTTNTAVSDQLLVINDGEAQNGVDNGSGESGLEVDRGANSGTPNDHAFFVFSETHDAWQAKLGSAYAPIGVSALYLGTATELQITESSDDIIYQNTVSNKKHIFQTNFDGSAGQTFLSVGGTIKGINTGNIDIVDASSDTVITQKTADKDIYILTAPFTDATCDTDTSAGSGTTFGNNPRLIQMDSTDKLRPGLGVSGTGIPSSATVVRVDSTTLFTLSADVTATNTNTTLTFTPNNASANLMIDGSTQRVGIGTGTPSANLHLFGDMYVSASEGASPTITIENDTDVSGEAELVFFRSTTDVAASMDIGHIKWKAKDDGGNTHTYGSIFVDAQDETGATEDGRFIFMVAKGGTDNVEVMRISGSEGFIWNDQSKDVDFRVESNGNTHMIHVDAGNDKVGIGGTPTGEFHTFSAGSGDNVIIETTVANSTTSAPNVVLYRNGATAEDNDLIGQIVFRGKNDAGSPQDVDFATIETGMDDVSDGSEDGNMTFNLIEAGTLTEFMRLRASTRDVVVNDQADDIDFRVESSSNQNMLFVDASTDAVGIGTASPDTNAALDVEGAIALDEISAPTATADRGKLYAMNTNNLFFQDGAGNNQPVMLGGRHSIWIPAEAISPRSNAGCAELAVTAAATNGRPDIRALGFDTSTDEHAQFTVAFPRTWNKGTVTAQFFWTAASGSGTVAWAIQGVALANDDAIDTAYGTAVLPATDTLTAAKDVHVTAETGAITIAGSPGHDELTSFQIYRDVSADNLGVDALLMGVKIFYTIAQGNENTAKDV